MFFASRGDVLLSYFEYIDNSPQDHDALRLLQCIMSLLFLMNSKTGETTIAGV